MRFLVSSITLAASLVLAPAAFADCVDFSQARADRAGAALVRNAPSAADLGLPSLTGLTLDGPKTAGDPRCGGGKPTRYYYTTALTKSALIEAWYPNIRRRTEADGMGRVWFKNPQSGDSFFITTGTEITIQTRGEQEIWQVVVVPPAALAPLTVEQQPYKASEISDWTPWPGGASGPRQFVRADTAPTAGSTAGARAPSTSANSQQTAPSGQQQATACPPASPNSAASNVGADIGGAVIGGGMGRTVGGALGGLFGGGQPKQQPAQNCPR